jgi:drug/metabolite transporter (DMT)-like permease
MALVERSNTRDTLLPVLIPGLFVLIWSTGFIVAKFGLPYAPPLTFLVMRFIGVLAVLAPCLVLMRAPWPSGQVLHIAAAGLLLQAGYLTGVWCAIELGMPAGVSALIVGMQPILTAAAAPLVGESVRPRQWAGLLLGLLGVGLVVSTKLRLDGMSVDSVALAVMALVSMTAGTLYQKRYCPRFDLRTGTAIQFAASLVVVLPLAVWLENLDWYFSPVQWTASFIGALLWSVFALSIGAIFLLFALIRSSHATRVTSLLYLTPPTTALMAWLMFDETLNAVAVAGMAVAAVGVSLVVRR